MTEAEATGKRVAVEYWLGESIRSMAEGDLSQALVFAKVAVYTLQDMRDQATSND
jgi:hypothetical protein